MTSTPVNVQGFTANALFGTNRVQGTETKGDFSKIFESQKNVTEDVKETNYAENDFREDSKVDDARSYDKATEAVNKADAEKKSTTVQESSQSDETSMGKNLGEDGLSEEEMERAAEVLQGAIADVKALLMQSLQMSEEELNAFMQEMNLTDVDLLQLGNVKDLMLQAMGAEDMMALLTDEDLYSQMRNMETAFADIMESVQNALEMNPEELNVALEQLDDVMQSRDEEAQKPITVEVTGIEETKAGMEMRQTKVDGAEEKGDADNQDSMQNGENPFLMQNQVNETQENTQTASAQMTSYATAETENIMRQLMDSMRLQMNADSTELSMQLEPENLGTLQIRISAKEGVMTAQFTTTSDVVKNVLEGQMIQLQQQFDQQNIKDEAIEVTVQTHSFENALEQGREQHTQEDNKRSNRTRRIDLGRLEMTEEITAEEQMLAEIMEANGNSVDYLV